VPLLGRWHLEPSAHQGNGRRRDPAPDLSTVAPSLAPLKGSIDIVVFESASADTDAFKPGDRARWGLRLHERRAVPLGPRDWIRIEAAVNRPAYLYVAWIDTDGKVTPLWPWQEGDWAKRPAKETPRDRLTLPLPDSTKDIMPLTPGPPGVEALLLLARDGPLNPSENETVMQTLAWPPARRLTAPAAADLAVAVWLENGERVDDEPTRAPILDKAGWSGDPENRIRSLMRDLRSVFPYTRAVCFGNQGNEQKDRDHAPGE
jgi:hypothetical protein